MGVLHSFAIKNIFHEKMNLRLFYFDVATFLKIQDILGLSRIVVTV